MSIRQRPITIGWKEWIDLPEWKLSHIRAKIDTGACSTALGVERYRILERDGQILVSFTPAIRRHSIRKPRRVVVPLVGYVRVRSTSGIVEVRPVIETTLQLGLIRKVIRLTLTNRSAMRHAIILGRSALRDDFIVDVGQKYVQVEKS